MLAGQDAYEKNKPAVYSSREDSKPWAAMEFAILGHVLFPKNLTRVDIGLLQFLEQIEQGRTRAFS